MPFPTSYKSKPYLRKC